ncbi:glycoside hydrolase family 43 protein [Sunxiuqinia sp. A32]|uniref:glycoside hydrolase family 43 protein n=1 Tax=Sunxiuqinia sp. A32 TaxID=3461496 RepID=UPI0040461FF4
MKVIFTALFLSFLFMGCDQAPKKELTTYYQNPVIPGDYPDPTIIRVGDMYYSAGTGSNFAPFYPLFESKDLVNWKQIGHIFEEKPSWTSQNFWAPELYYKDGTYFAYYTAKRKGDNVSCIGVATTDDIHKGFTDHGIIIEWGEEAIDAYIFQDDDGKLYISWKAYGLTKGRPIELLCSELSDDGMSLVGEHFTLTDFEKGWNGAGDEGQCMVKHGDYYYLLYSAGGCCGNRCTYQVMVSRSKDIRSGWEQNPDPIIKGGDEWQCTGHGTLVDTPDGRFFYMYHSYNATDFEYVGRQGMLNELVWDEETLWPRLKEGNTPSRKAETPFKNTVQVRDTVFIDDFINNDKAYMWQWDVTLGKPDFTIADGELNLVSSEAGFACIGLRPLFGTYSLSTEILNEGEANEGIAIYGNQQKRLALISSSNGLSLYQLKDGAKTELANVAINGKKPLQLKVDVKNGRYFQFFWAEEEDNWQPIEIDGEYTVDGNFLPAWDTAMRVGFIVEGALGITGKFSNVCMKYDY